MNNVDVYVSSEPNIRMVKLYNYKKIINSYDNGSIKLPSTHTSNEPIVIVNDSDTEYNLYVNLRLIKNIAPHSEVEIMYTVTTYISPQVSINGAVVTKEAMPVFTNVRKETPTFRPAVIRPPKILIPNMDNPGRPFATVDAYKTRVKGQASAQADRRSKASGFKNI